MTRFMIRVELHNARLAAQYERLHALLAAQGIVNEIVADNGQCYQLPPAEYHYLGNATQDRVLAAAKQCASQVDTDNAVVVAVSTQVVWDGLKRRN